ncbi:MAG TPA: methyltransferase domain-containing protein [Bryobacteraceae bacterium]|jgi:ubiquinone/menaquinone biosynthesis C-methylase UbiE|nr:methyltransferase domain-containing protein [Bryobacteraceae bacterium]
MATAFFDRVASRYDELWTNTDTGRLQRAAVWRHVDPLFRTGTHILDLGCGTGEDAVHYSEAGVRVTAFDASPEMVRVARNRGVDAHVLAIEELSTLEGSYDGAISNFGALNCVPDPAELRPLAQLIRPGGHLAICIIGRFCLRESLHFLGRGRIGKAIRRWNGVNRSASLLSTSLDLSVYYPTVQQIRRALAPDFVLSKTTGIGVCVPPSYISTLSPKALAFCEGIDRRLAHRRFFRALSDHRLLIFRRK